MRERPEVSVVIAAWNAEEFITCAVRSALEQQGIDLEVIVVDDASSDRTAETVEQVRDPRVHLLRQDRNGGPGSARNRGFAAANGRWIAVLDADDRMEPGRLSEMVAAGETATADGVVDDLMEVSESGRPLGPFFGRHLRGKHRLDLPTFILSNVAFSRRPNFGYMKPLFRAAFLRKHALAYEPSLRIGEDYMLLADALAAGAEVVILPRPLYLYTRRQGSVSHRLTLPRIENLQAMDLAFARRWRLTAEARRALGKRAAAFADAAAFTQAVTSIKASNWRDAAGALRRRPMAALLFRYPLGARIARAAGTVRERGAG